LTESRVALIDQHDFALILLLQPEHLLVSDSDVVQPAHLVLSDKVTPCDAVLLEVNGDAAAGNEIICLYLVLWVIWGAEEFTTLLVQELTVHL